MPENTRVRLSSRSTAVPRQGQERRRRLLCEHSQKNVSQENNLFALHDLSVTSHATVSARLPARRIPVNSWMSGASFAMRISELNWMMVEEYLKRDNRAVL